MRKAEETKTMLFPALAQMLSEVDDDQEEWAATEDDDKLVCAGKINFVAKDSINIISLSLGEKVVLSSAVPLLKAMIKS